MNESVETSPQFPAWLRRQLDRRGWTAADLNRESGIATQTISKWLRGERTPRKPELIHKLADSLDVHQDEILERLNMRDGGADRMSLAVRYVAPTIDKYDWDEEELDLIVRYIESLAWMKSRR